MLARAGAVGHGGLVMGEGVPVACDLSALTPAKRRRRSTLAQTFRRAVEEIVEAEDGFGFRVDAEALPAIAEFVLLERRCCPFLRFDLGIDPDGGAVWLRLGGREGTKEFLRHRLGLD